MSSAMNQKLVQRYSQYLCAIRNLSSKRSMIDVLFWLCYLRLYWNVVDTLHKVRYPKNYRITCGICGYSERKKIFETKIARCFFNGGVLERYICPQCGVIFGPLKIAQMSRERLGREYRIHYKIFKEGDSTTQEMESFFALTPKKGKKYLNYGSGCWSDTFSKLTELGYEIYNYEPFAAESKQTHVITDRQRLLEMRFDGIFSCNVIEHLQDPIEELAFMYSLLNPDGKMAHGTACYEYAYEYTRFHLFFFVGQSLGFLAKGLGCGLQLSDRLVPTEAYRVCVFKR
jgi:hypothetical protein